MMEEPLAPQERASSESSSHIVHALLQFAMAIKHRKNIVILCVFVTLICGAFYYSTATRLYSAQAELVILASGDETKTTGIATQGANGKNLMQTFERMITSSNVIEDAVERLGPKERIDLAEVPRSKWVLAIQKNLSAKSIYGTNNIEIQYLSRDPAAAVAVVNSVVEAYLNFMDLIHKRTSDELIHGLEEQQAELAKGIEAWQLLLSKKKAECGDYLSTNPDSKAEHPLFERLAAMEEEQRERGVERAEYQVKLESLQEAVARGDDLLPHIMDLEEDIGNEMLSSVLGISAQDKSKFAEIARKRTEDMGKLEAMLRHYGEQHPEVIALRASIHVAEDTLARRYQGSRQQLQGAERDELAQQLMGFLRQKVEGLARAEQKLAEESKYWQTQANGIFAEIAEIQRIEGQIEWGQELRDRLLNQLVSFQGAEAGPIIRAELVSDPVQATNPSSPSLRRTVMLALLAGLAMGLAAVYVLDTLDDRFRSVEELQAQVGVPVMAIIQEFRSRHTSGVESLQLVREPDALESEAFRTLRTSLALTHDQSRRMVVTSAEPGDGKSTVLANVAVAYANSGKRTLLIDADLRRPGLSTMLGIRGPAGLAAVLRSTAPIAEAMDGNIHETPVRGLDVLPAGPRPMNPTELLGSQRFADLLAWADGRYDYILIDSPPTLAASDTAVIGQLVDGVLMVVQPRKNQRRMVLRAAETFALLKIPLIGLVANRVGQSGASGYYGYAVDYSAQPEPEQEYYDYGDEIDCPPEPTSRGSSQHPSGDGGIDLSQLGELRRRDAA